MSRSTEARAASDHAMIRKEFAMLQKTHADPSNRLKEIGANVEELLKRSTV